MSHQMVLAVSCGEAQFRAMVGGLHLQLQRQRHFIVRDVRVRPYAASFLIPHRKRVAEKKNVKVKKLKCLNTATAMMTSNSATHVGAISAPTIAATATRMSAGGRRDTGLNTQSTCCRKLKVHVVCERCILKLPTSCAVDKPAKCWARMANKLDALSETQCW
jgi:hypothetical protein